MSYRLPPSLTTAHCWVNGDQDNSVIRGQLGSFPKDRVDVLLTCKIFDYNVIYTVSLRTAPRTKANPSASQIVRIDKRDCVHGDAFFSMTGRVIAGMSTAFVYSS